MSSTSGKGGGSTVWVARHSANVRICHWINLIACGYLLVSGVHIFLDFPELYWGHTGYQCYPAIFRLSDWGLSWDEAGALGNRMWGRNYHVTFAWVFLINGLVYVVWNIATRNAQAQEHYGALQRTSYLILIFVFVPLMILTGIAQSPGFTAALPWLLDLFGGRQSARTLHTVGTLLLIVFAIVHVLEVAAAGLLNQVRSMVTGKFLLPEEGP